MIRVRVAFPKLLVAIVAGGWTGGCSLVDSVRFWSADSSQISIHELWNELDDYTTSACAEVRRATDAVRDSTTDRTKQRDALRWKMNSVTEFRRAMSQDDPLAAMLDLWSLTVQVRQGFEATPPFHDLGTEHDATLAAVRSLEGDIRAIADAVLDDAQLSAAVGQIEDYSRAHPLSRGFGRTITASDTRTWQGYAALEAVLAVPLSPIRALQGIDTGAQAIAEFASVADRFSSVVSQTPEILRWQAELLVFSLDDTPALKSIEEGATSIAASSQRLATVAETLPTEFQSTVQNALDRLRESENRLAPMLADARATASEAHLALASLDRAVTGALGLTKELNEASAGFAATGKEWAATLSVLRDITGSESDRASAPPSSGRPFDIREYGTVAIELSRAATELRATLTELDRVLDETRVEPAADRVDETARRATDHAREAAEAVIDHAFQRGLLLVGLALLGWFVFRFLASKLSQR